MEMEVEALALACRSQLDQFGFQSRVPGEWPLDWDWLEEKRKDGGEGESEDQLKKRWRLCISVPFLLHSHFQRLFHCWFVSLSPDASLL